MTTEERKLLFDVILSLVEIQRTLTKLLNEDVEITERLKNMSDKKSITGG